MKTSGSILDCRSFYHLTVPVDYYIASVFLFIVNTNSQRIRYTKGKQ